MTREEIISNLLYMKRSVKEDTIEDITINEAIKALEKKPDAIHNEREQAYMKGYEDASNRYRTEPCGDAISRQAAIDVICAGSLSAATVYGRTDKGMAALKETVKLIKELQPVTPAPKMGRWIEVTDEETPTTRTWHYECSECGTPLKAVEKTRCCSECGALLLVDAKMEGIKK